VVIQGISPKHEKHEVAPPLVVGRRGFENDHDHRSYIFDAGSLRMKVRDEGDIEVGDGVKGAVIIIILGDCDLLDNGDLLFQVMSDVLLLLPSEGGSMLTQMNLI
jgi:hypothetical protein